MTSRMRKGEKCQRKAARNQTVKFFCLTLRRNFSKRHLWILDLPCWTAAMTSIRAGIRWHGKNFDLKQLTKNFSWQFVDSLAKKNVNLHVQFGLHHSFCLQGNQILPCLSCWQLVDNPVAESSWQFDNLSHNFVELIGSLVSSSHWFHPLNFYYESYPVKNCRQNYKPCWQI